MPAFRNGERTRRNLIPNVIASLPNGSRTFTFSDNSAFNIEIEFEKLILDETYLK
jgi:hypothetical protein